MGPRPRSVQIRGSSRPRKLLKRTLLGFVLGCLMLLAYQMAEGRVPQMGIPQPPAASRKPAPPPKAGQRQQKAHKAPAPRAGWAQETSTRPKLAANELSPVKVGITLGGVLVLLFGATLLLKKLLRKSRFTPGKTKVLELIDALPLGQQRFVYVLNLQGRTLVLGAGGERVNLLAEYGEDEWSAEMALQNPLARKSQDNHSQVREGPSAKERPQRSELAQAGPSLPLKRALHAYQQAPGESFSQGGPAQEELLGAHRVPPAFRHLLKRALEAKESEA